MKQQDYGLKLDKIFMLKNKTFPIINTDRTFGAGIAVELCNILKRSKAKTSNLIDGLYPIDHELQFFAKENYITINTKGNGGISYGFVNIHGVCLNHEGPLQDGVGKSMSGGILSVRGNVCNVLGYGASGGKFFINGKAGTRTAIL